MTPGDVSAALALHGLILRGGFDFDAADERPDGPSGRPAASVLLVGSAGASWWSPFQRWRTAQPVDPANPLDTWSRTVVGAVAEAARARLVMPSDRPYAPFQRWAARAEGVKSSPLGLLMHPAYGLWHAYRAALLFDEPLSGIDTASRNPAHPCDSCAERPCLQACPVDAHSAEGFEHRRCIEHVRSTGGAPCRAQGCLDRNACPCGTSWRYPAHVQAFFQRSFAGV